MWRAYGGASGVAIVIKSSALLLSYEGLGVYSSPVAYLDAAGFETKLAEVLDGWEAAKDILKQYSRDELLWRVMNMFRFAVLSTKHPGFVEEREWRLIHFPQIEGVGKHVLKPCIKTIRGVPQPVRRLPLDGSEGAEGIKLSSIIDLVVIGPTQFPQVIREAFIDALTRRGVEDPSSKIVVSGIPLRT